MSSDYIRDLGRYCSPHSLLVVTPQGLVRLHCPFEVVAREGVGPIGRYEKAEVERVKVAPDLRLIYEIEGRSYSYHHFLILL